MGHGNSWAAVIDDVSSRVPEVLEWATGSPNVGTILTPENDAKDRVVLALGNRGDGLGVLALCDFRSEIEGPELTSMFPFSFDGEPYRFRFERSTEWKDPIEAELHGSLVEPPVALSFFDGGYARFRRDYQPDGEYDVRLAMVAYALQPGVDNPAQITNPEVIRAMRAGHEDAFKSDGTENLEPITVHLTGGAMFFPFVEGHPGVAEFMGNVEEVRELELLGEKVYRVMVEVAKDESRLVLPIFATHHGLADGWTPRVGDWVQGMGWIHGYREGAFDDES